MCKIKNNIALVIVSNLFSWSCVPYVMCCVIWYHLCNLKKVKDTHRGVLLLRKLQALACFLNSTNGTKSHKASHIIYEVALGMG